jgi:uroporphyrinogen decarboxylase
VNGRQRILTALSVEQPDRVPVWIHAINEVAIARIGQLLREGSPQPKAVNLMSQEEMLALMDTLFLIHTELSIDGFTSLPMSELVNTVDIDGVRFRDQWGTVWARSPHGMAYMVEAPLADPESLDGYVRPAVTPAETFMVEMARQRFQGSKAQFLLMRGVFVRSWRLRGMETLLVDMVDRPQWVHSLARMVTDYNLDLCRQAIAAGVDVLIVEDDVAGNDGPLISPGFFLEYVAPYNQEVLDLAHDHGLKVVRHSDGNLWPILDSLIDMGYDGLNPLEPQAGMHLGRVKEYCGDRLCLLGNIDCGDLLCSGNEEQVEESVIQAIADAGAGGGYILCSSNSIHPGVRPENFVAMVRAAKRHGTYPLVDA